MAITTTATQTEADRGFQIAPGKRVGRFGPTSVPSTSDMDSFLRAVGVRPPIVKNGLEDDLRIIHSGESLARAIPRGYNRGHTVFGCGQSSGDAIFALNTARMRVAETVILHQTVFSPQSASVMREGFGFYEPSLVNFGDRPEALDGLVSMDPLYQYDAEGEICFSDAATNIRRIDVIGMPICGTGFHNYGHFLFDGLPLAYLLKSALPDVPIALVGAGLSPWQHEILEALGMAEDYMALVEPTLFSRLIVPNLIAQHVSYPTRWMRPMMDALRFRVAATTTRHRRIFISRRNDLSKRVMLNRTAIETLLSHLGFEVVVPETLSFAEQVKLFASCDFIIGESGAGMANVVFCDPGTKILEIQPENFIEGWIRASSMIMALEWNVYFAKAVMAEAGSIKFTVDENMLRAAIETIVRDF